MLAQKPAKFGPQLPTVGKWERRTERERIAGTDSRRADFDESRLAEEYEPASLSPTGAAAAD